MKTFLRKISAVCMSVVVSVNIFGIDNASAITYDDIS